MIRHFGKNAAGRDFVVGDIHGYFSRLQEALAACGFAPGKDRLFSVGDLVDRGPECELALDWLAQPWFHAVRGNHEDYAIRHSLTGRVDVDNYMANGGGWFLGLPAQRQKEFGLAFDKLPYA
ncbi:MAG: metallophosphoesterase, partial [Pollutimonas bauzanensis]